MRKEPLGSLIAGCGSRKDRRGASALPSLVGPLTSHSVFARPHSRLLGYCLILGLYLTLRGYHSLDGDQAYRLPLFLHIQDPSLFADDPFVRAFDVFNPHRGSFLLLGGATKILGLSAGLLALFIATFLATCRGIDRLGNEVWTGRKEIAGWVAVIDVLMAKAGNIGTNHLFEAMVLDRLMALAAGWLAISSVIARPERGWWRAALALALATLVHPSLGLQLATVVGAAWIVWALAWKQTGVSWALAARGVGAAGLAVLPGLALNLPSGDALLRGLSPQDLWTLSVELQNPQHMLPHLWRMPQWLAWGAYLVLAAVAWLRGAMPNRARVKVVILLVVVLVWLAGAWVAIEIAHNLRVTMFQPFRLATLVRGLALVLIAGRVADLWAGGGWFGKTRAMVIALAGTGDWSFVVVALAEVGVALAEQAGEQVARLVYGGLLGWGLCFLAQHDTESGQWPILSALALGLVARRLSTDRWPVPDLRTLVWTRPAAVLSLTWAVPLLAMLSGALPEKVSGAVYSGWPLARGLVAHCRFVAVPTDDIERLGVWCRDHTPADSRFIGPPGPKNFRLWSRRSLAFNRSCSPYHAAGLAEWFGRFQDHVDLHVPPSAFVRRYVAGRHEIEARYDSLDETGLAALACRQGADHVIASTSLRGQRIRLNPLHTEGAYTVYKLISQPDALAADQRQR
jgi:hypothetical protein